MAWDNDVLLTGAMLEANTLSAKNQRRKVAYTKAGNLAEHLQLAPVEGISLRVPLNFIFVGFRGDGNRGVSLTSDEVRRWFEHMDFVLPHTRVPVDEVTDGSKPLDPDMSLPITSMVHYNYSCHVIEVGAEVNDVLERAINFYKRPHNPVSKGERLEQVDAAQMSALLESLLKELEVEKNAYNVIIMNPHRMPGSGAIKYANYGYREGFSDKELEQLRNEPGSIPEIGGAPGSAAQAAGALKDSLGDINNAHPPPRTGGSATSHFFWNNELVYEAEDWAKKVGDVLSTLEKTREVTAQATSDANEMHLSALRDEAASLLRGSDMDAAGYVNNIIKNGGEGAHEECLVDTWVGQGRYLWADLTAGGDDIHDIDTMTWGPAVGGVGVRMAHGLPSVDSLFGHLPEGGKTDHTNLELSLESMADERFAELDEEEEDDVTLITAELDVYEMFALTHCKNRQREIPLCEELSLRVAELEEELKQVVEKQKKQAEESGDTAKAEVKRRSHDWGIFGNDDFSGNFSLSRDLFQSELGTVIANAMRHVVTPSTASQVYHYHKKVSFLVYLVNNQQTYKPDAPENLEMAVLKREIERLSLPSQSFQVAVHKLSLGDDPALALAFAAAKRSVMIPTIKTGGEFKVRPRMYLESHELQHQLLELNKNRVHHKRGVKYSISTGASPDTVLEVPIFVFSVDTDVPLFIDKHYQAKSLPDMVLVVQNTHTSWDSHISCNGKPIVMNLRRPLKAAIGAVAQHLGGVLPSHITYSLPHKKASQDWLWATGGHAMAQTSNAAKLSQIQVDVVHRSYILSSLDLSIKAVNEAVSLLQTEPTHADTFRLFQSLPTDALLEEYYAVRRLWKDVVSKTERLEYNEAISMLESMEAHAATFHSLAKEISAAMHPVVCTQQKRLQLSALHIAGLAILAVSTALFLVLRPRKHKPKIN